MAALDQPRQQEGPAFGYPQLPVATRILSPHLTDRIPQAPIDDRLPYRGDEVVVDDAQGRVRGVVENAPDLARAPRLSLRMECLLFVESPCYPYCDAPLR